jgi:hypothetical protein
MQSKLRMHLSRSPDKEREPLPVTGDAERALPDARRNVTGRSEG